MLKLFNVCKKIYSRVVDNNKTSPTLIHLRIDCYFRAHIEYKRPDVGLKIYREARYNLRLGVYTPYAHENSNQSLYLHFLYHIFY